MSRGSSAPRCRDSGRRWSTRRSSPRSRTMRTLRGVRPASASTDSGAISDTPSGHCSPALSRISSVSRQQSTSSRRSRSSLVSSSRVGWARLGHPRLWLTTEVSMTDGLSRETLAAQALGAIDQASGALSPAIHPSTIYERSPDGTYRSGLAYTRADNPTYDHAERLLAALEGGVACMLFASGSAAATAVFQSPLPGDHVLVSRILYWGVRKWLAEFAVSWGLDVEFVDTTNLGQVAAAIRPGRTRLLWVETPANPTWDVTDIAAVTTIARAADVRVAVDSTAASPVLTRPIGLGADLVVHSATKYLNGHSDVLAGAVVSARVDPFWERIRSWRRSAGAVLGPFEAWLLQRGMRTLFVRVRRSSETALAIARHLEGHSALKAVLYPGLPSHPGYEVARRHMMGGFSGMLSIRVADGEAGAMAVAGSVQVFRRAVSLGGVESLIEHRRRTEGPSSPVPDALLRLSIGLEHADDLTERVRQILHAEVNPAVAAHGGRVSLVDVTDGRVRIRMEGGCQGCSLAEVTIRQGIEQILRARIPEIAGVIDTTDHSAGTHPFFAPGKR